MRTININIAVDVMGGDNAPEEIIKGALKAVSESKDANLLLVGKSDIICKQLKTADFSEEKVEIIDAPEVINMKDSPSKSLRKKKKSSINIGTRLIKENRAGAFISAGNTGAVMAAGLLNIGRLSGIKRPAIGTFIPSHKGKTLVMDAGANVDSKPLNLLQSSLMGQLYARLILNKNNPKIGLLSIGEEEEKGNKLTTETYKLINNDVRITNFIGNVEGRDVFNGSCDVIICDGFTGNIVLKTTEGAASFVLDNLKEAFTSNFLTRIGAFLLKSRLKNIKQNLDYRQYGGAPLLGLQGPVIISHGSSDAVAIYNAVLLAKKIVKNNVIKEIEKIIHKEGEKNE